MARGGDLSSGKTDIGAVVALSWIAFAVLITFFFGPMLGLRGWGWLLVHHLLCAVGCGSELRRSAARRAARAEEATRRLRAGQERY
jgi:hypothetical protein